MRMKSRYGLGGERSNVSSFSKSLFWLLTFKCKTWCSPSMSILRVDASVWMKESPRSIEPSTFPFSIWAWLRLKYRVPCSNIKYRWMCACGMSVICVCGVWDMESWITLLHFGMYTTAIMATVWMVFVSPCANPSVETFFSSVETHVCSSIDFPAPHCSHHHPYPLPPKSHHHHYHGHSNTPTVQSISRLCVQSAWPG